MTGIGVMFIRGCIPTIDTIATIALALKLAAIFSRSPIPRVRTIPAIAFISCTAGGYPNHESARILAGPLKTRVVDNSIAPTYANAIRMGDSVPKSPRLPKISPGVFNLRNAMFQRAMDSNVVKFSFFRQILQYCCALGLASLSEEDNASIVGGSRSYKREAQKVKEQNSHHADRSQSENWSCLKLAHCPCTSKQNSARLLACSSSSRLAVLSLRYPRIRPSFLRRNKRRSLLCMSTIVWIEGQRLMIGSIQIFCPQC